MKNKTKTIDVTQALPEFYLPFAGYVIQTRALPDARDGLKTGARYILYAQYKDKLTHDKNARKAVATVNAAMRYSPHGDSSIYGNAVRMSQKFSLRYPIITTQGNNGSFLAGDDFSAPRYIEMYSNKIASEICGSLKKGSEIVDKWNRNYTDEEDMPTVLPTKFPFGLVNGNTGIGVGCASSIPQFNLREVSNSLQILLNNPNASFEELYCPIDFATGGILINEDETKESLKTGRGKAALVRAVLEYDENSRTIIVKELPYQVFTDTIAMQIQKGIDENRIFGIDEFFDGTGKKGINFKIKLTKTAIPEKVIRQLHKETSLQSHFGINLMLLEDGIIPKRFSWNEMLSSYLNHLQNVIRKEFEIDLQQIQARTNILNGYLKALANIDEVVKLIKSSKSTIEATTQLMEVFGFNELQAKSILDLKLQRLVNMEYIKIEKELLTKTADAQRIENILNSEKNFKKEVSSEITRISNSYGDNRRTQLMNLEIQKDNEEGEVIEEKQLFIQLTNRGNIITNEMSTLIAKKRVKANVKLANGEFIISAASESNIENAIVFTNKGKVFSIHINELPINAKVHASTFFELESGETPISLMSLPQIQENKYLTLVTKHGIIKKSLASEYNIKSRKKTGVMGIKFKKPEDEIISALLLNDEDKISVVTKNGLCLILKSEEIRPIGRAAMGVIGITLKKDEVIAAKVVKDSDSHLITITNTGIIKKTLIEEYPIHQRAAKGILVAKLKDGETIAGVEITSNQTEELLILLNDSSIKFNNSTLKETGRFTLGVIGTKLSGRQEIIGLISVD